MQMKGSIITTMFLRWQKSYYTPWNFDKFSPINLMSGGALVPTLQSIAQLQEDTIRGLVLKGESFYHSKSRSQCKVLRPYRGFPDYTDLLKSVLS